MLVLFSGSTPVYHLLSNSQKTPNVRVSIVEAKMPKKMEDSVAPSYLGAQTRATNTPQKLPSSVNQPNSEPSRFLNSLTDGGRGYGKWSPVGRVSAHNDFIEESLPVGQILDVNTIKYEYLGYLTQVRKSVELAMYNPLSELRKIPHIYEKLLRGESVSVQSKSSAVVTIEKSGLVSSVEITESDGNLVIDQAWIKILNLAAPFAPLPEHFKQSTLKIRYTLYYGTVLQGGVEKKLFRF